MIDKLVKISDNEVLIVFTDGPPFTVTSSEGTAVQLALWLLSPTRLNSEQFARALTTQGEDTLCSILKAA
jgi:predicted metal-dependent peptidase